MNHNQLIDEYLAGPARLRQAIAGLTGQQLDAQPIAGRWSTRQVVCHIADFEPIYADRIKRVLAEELPTFFGGNPDLFAARLAYAQRDVEEELQLIEAVRKHLARILKTLPPGDFQRQGIHATAGPMTVEQLLGNITQHIPHHLPFIAKKRQALGV